MQDSPTIDLTAIRDGIASGALGAERTCEAMLDALIARLEAGF